ncbi:pyrophosphate-energized membrane proton pump 3 [Tanacetum coccineum]
MANVAGTYLFRLHVKKVGDNVGDCAARGADLFERIAIEIISDMVLGGTMAHRCKIEVIDLFFSIRGSLLSNYLAEADLRSNGIRMQPMTLAKDREVLKDSGMDSNIPADSNGYPKGAVQSKAVSEPGLKSNGAHPYRLINKEQDNPDPFSYDNINLAQAWLIDLSSILLMTKEQDNPDPFSYDNINLVQAWLIDLSSILLAERGTNAAIFESISGPLKFSMAANSESLGSTAIISYNATISLRHTSQNVLIELGKGGLKSLLAVPVRKWLRRKFPLPTLVLAESRMDNNITRNIGFYMHKIMYLLIGTPCWKIPLKALVLASFNEFEIQALLPHGSDPTKDFDSRDRHLGERIANVLTSIPFIAVGIQASSCYGYHVTQ